MRIFERQKKKARHQFVRMNGVDPWDEEPSAIRSFFTVTCEVCGYLFAMAGIVGLCVLLVAL